MLLDYLVTSRTRRGLLRLLWGEDAHGSASELARRARLGFANTYRELETMRAGGLVASERTGNRVIYRQNPSYARAPLLRELVRGPRNDRPGDGEGNSDDQVRGWLNDAGAPLVGVPPAHGRAPALEECLVAGVALAHRDATVARVLPLVFWRQRERLDFARVEHEAKRRNERHAVGFFLELTSQLSHDVRFARAAKVLRDRRRTRTRMFFTQARGQWARTVARRNTPRLARKWGYLMNMTLDSFASLFDK